MSDLSSQKGAVRSAYYVDTKVNKQQKAELTRLAPLDLLFLSVSQFLSAGEVSQISGQDTEISSWNQLIGFFD